MHDAIVKTIRDLMDQRGLSCYALSKLSGLDTTGIGKIVNTKSKPIYPSFLTIAKICKACNISLEEFGRMYDANSKNS